MGISERKKRERERVKASILKAAKELFCQYGYHHVSMRKIAHKIEYSPTTIYHYFKNKDEILTYIVKDYFDDFIEHSKPILQHKKTKPYDTLYDYLILFAHKSLEHAPQYRFLASIFSSQTKIQLGKTNANIGYAHIRELLQLCMEKELIRSDDLDLITQSLWSVLYGLTVLLTTRPDFEWVERDRLIQYTVEKHLNGLK